MNNFQEEYGFTQQEWEICLSVLDKLKNQPLANPNNAHFSGLITKIHKTAKKHRKQASYPVKKANDLVLMKSAVIAKNALANTTYFSDVPQATSPTFSPLSIPKNCYCCNQSYQQIHSFYHRLCPSCAKLNYQLRSLTIDLSGRNVILTGGRVKIGYATALKLLRSKANVTITTRFPAIALAQFEVEKDYADWQKNLMIYGLDLRNLKAVEQFIEFYKKRHTSLNILINNAAQTIQYPANYYHPLIARENKLLAVSDTAKKVSSNKTPLVGDLKMVGASPSLSEINLNRFGQPVDNRTKNSWNATLTEIPTTELLEVNLINHISPYLLIKGLTDLMNKSAFQEKFILNVTSSEGQFSYHNKTIFHPHTNMTKAALNMLTRTVAVEYEKYGIYMNAVDVGWVSTGAIEPLRKRQFEEGYIPPLDAVDGAARIIHPIAKTLQNEVKFVGKLLKNYKIVDW